MRGDLVDALETLLRDLDNRRCTFKRVLLETTGLADPAPVLHTMMSHPYLLLRYRLDGVVTVVDAVNGEATLDAHAEAVKQAADRRPHRADQDRSRRRRTDATRSARVCTRSIRPRRCSMPPRARRPPSALFGCGLYDPDTKIPDVKRWLAAEAYAERMRMITRHGHGHHHHDAEPARRPHPLLRDRRPTQPVPAGTLEMFLELLRATHGDKLLRVKGIVKLAEMPGHAGGRARRAARLSSDRAAGALAGRRPPHPPRLHHPRPARAHRARTVRRLHGRAWRPTGRIAPRSPTIRWSPSAGVTVSSRLAAALRGLAIMLHRSSDAESTAGARWNTAWNGSGCSIIRRAFPPRSTRRAIASLVAMFEESFARFSARDACDLHGQDDHLRRARRGLARLRRLSAERAACNAAPASR